MYDDLTKKYYRIGEVAEITGIPMSTLRYWESRFTAISPRRNARGTRYYTPADVEKIRMIHYLVKEKGLHLDAAQQQITHNAEGLERRSEVLEKLRGLRAQIAGMLDAMTHRR